MIERSSSPNRVAGDMDAYRDSKSECCAECRMSELDKSIEVLRKS